jgi:HEAT repeat protein
MLGGREAKPAIPVFMAVLKSDRELAPRIAAANALAMFGADAAEAIPELVRAFDSSDDELSSAAIRALGRIQPADPLVLPCLIRALQKDATLGDAAEALAMMGKTARSATPDLLQALPRAERLDRQRPKQRAASNKLFDLQQMGSWSFRATLTETVEAALESVADGELAEVIAARQAQQVEPVRAALKSRDPLVRTVAAEALSNWPGAAGPSIVD